jgi:hypothetical protein
MSTWYVINESPLGGNIGSFGAGVRVKPGDFVDDSKVNTAPLTAAGIILWPASDPIVAGYAQLAQAQVKRGNGEESHIGELMLTGALLSLLGGGGSGVLGPSSISVGGGTFSTLSGAGQVGGLVQKATLGLGFAAINGVAGTSTTVNVVAPGGSTPALPANARILAHEIRVATPFTGGAISAMTLSLGITGTTTQIVNAQSIFTAVGNLPGTAGADVQPFYSASTQLIATITSTGANLTALTAGALTLDVLYTVLA